MGSKPDHSQCTLQQGSGVWLQPECGRWVAYLPLEDLCSGKRLTPSQAILYPSRSQTEQHPGLLEALLMSPVSKLVARSWSKSFAVLWRPR